MGVMVVWLACAGGKMNSWSFRREMIDITLVIKRHEDMVFIWWGDLLNSTYSTIIHWPILLSFLPQCRVSERCLVRQGGEESLLPNAILVLENSALKQNYGKPPPQWVNPCRCLELISDNKKKLRLSLCTLIKNHWVHLQLQRQEHQVGRRTCLSFHCGRRRGRWLFIKVQKLRPSFFWWSDIRSRHRPRSVFVELFQSFVLEIEL